MIGLWRLVRLMLLLPAVAVLLLVAGMVAWALAHNEAATAQVLGHLPGVTVTDPSGSLLGDFKARRIDVALPRGGHLSLVEPQWQALSLRLDWAAQWGVGLHAQRLSVRRLVLDWVSDPKSPRLTTPPDLSLPIGVQVDALTVQEALGSVWGQTPLEGLSASVALQAHDGRKDRHRIHLSHLQWQNWTLSGDVAMDLDQSMSVQAALQAQGAARLRDVRIGGLVRVQVQGPLRHLRVVARTQGGAGAGSLSASVELTPFDVWPVPGLTVQFTQWNLAAWLPGTPRTQLSGSLALSPRAQHDVLAKLDLHNAAAAAWDQQAVPLRSASGQLTLLGVRSARDLAQALSEGAIDLMVGLPTATPAQKTDVSIRGGWGGQRQLEMVWQGLEPRALLSTAPALQLQGRVLVQPDWHVAQGSLRHMAQVPAVIRGAVQGLVLSGQAGGQRVQGEIQARVQPGQLDIDQLLLRSGVAQAQARGTSLRWGPHAGWQIKSAVQISDFDPQVWLPWPASVTGRNRLSGLADVDLDSDWRGQVHVRLEPSLLADVPLVADVQWSSPKSQSVMQVQAQVEAAGNTLQGHASLPWSRSAQGAWQIGAQSQWQGTIHAPALQKLQGMASLLGGRQVTGVVDAEVHAQGMWPLLRTRGQLHVRDFQWLRQEGASVSLSSAQAQWDVDTLGAAVPVHVDVALSQGQAGNMQLSRAQFGLTGLLSAHTARLTVDLSHKSAKTGVVTPLHLSVATQGAWRRSGSRSDWTGRFTELQLGLADASERTLLKAEPFELAWRNQGVRQQVDVSATDVTVMGALLKLRQLAWQTQDVNDEAQGELHLDAQLAPLNLGAVLARWQPEAGWGGDLMMAGQVRIRHSRAQPWTVDAEVSRQSGDIIMSEPTIEGHVDQKLGIRQARVALQSRNGVWTLEESFDGRITGAVNGRQVVQARSPAQWPQASDPLSGDLRMQIGNLRPWGLWIPAGWRLSGELQGDVHLAGTLGAPQYAGAIQGRNLALSQVLLGLNVSDGVLQMDMQGDHVHLTRFDARSGSQGGTLSARGQAVLGEHAELTLQVNADHFAALQRVDRRVVVSGQARAVLGEDRILVDGQVCVDEGLIDISKSDAPTVGDDVNVLGRDHPDVADEASASTAPRRKVDASVDLDLGHKLKLKGHGLDAFLTGKLHLSTPNGKPAIKGTVKVENGTFAAYGQKLVLERSTLSFTGTIENPRLDILAMRPQSPAAADSDVKVGVSITGTAQDPRVSLYSDPAMSETEKLSWLVLGRAPTGLGGADIGLLQTAAVALLSGEGSTPTDNVVNMLGLDDLSVRQTDDTVHDTVVNVGKQVSKYWYVGYERNLNATGGNWQLIYRLAKRLTVRAQAGADNAIDFIWAWRWD